MELDLGVTDNDPLPTDRRIKNCKDPAENPGLVSLLFHYGRYLLIASSRPGTQRVVTRPDAQGRLHVETLRTGASVSAGDDALD